VGNRNREGAAVAGSVPVAGDWNSAPAEVAVDNPGAAVAAVAVGNRVAAGDDVRAGDSPIT
jgi:hypothetical protein